MQIQLNDELEEGELAVTDSLNQIKIEKVLALDPFFEMNEKPMSIEDAYYMSLRSEIQTLFQNSDEKLVDINRMALISMDLNCNFLSAQLFVEKMKNSVQKDSKDLNYWLFNLEKLNVTSIKSNYHLDTEHIFFEIEKERFKEFKNSEINRLVKSTD